MRQEGLERLGDRIEAATDRIVVATSVSASAIGEGNSAGGSSLDVNVPSCLVHDRFIRFAIASIVALPVTREADVSKAD